MKKRRILVVEDEAAVADPIKRYLEACGPYEVLLEAQGALALPAARRFLPELIVLDVMLPDGDGGEIADALRSEGGLSRVPILFMSGAATKAEAKGGTIGGKPFLSKPFSMDELRRAIERLLPPR